MSRSRSADPSSSSSSNTLVGSAYHHPDSRQIVNHMKKLFSELEPPFSSELAMRVVTHKGAISPNATASRSQHNERLSFLGRRILRLYLAVFYQTQTTALTQTTVKLTEAALEDTVGTLTLGKHVASRWQLEGNLHWRQMVGPDGRPTGLDRISGQAVEAIIGAIFRQHGASIAMQAFHSRILPFLPLPAAFVQPALQLAKLHSDLSLPLNAALEDPLDSDTVAEEELAAKAVDAP